MSRIRASLYFPVRADLQPRFVCVFQAVALRRLGKAVAPALESVPSWFRLVGQTPPDETGQGLLRVELDPSPQDIRCLRLMIELGHGDFSQAEDVHLEVVLNNDQRWNQDLKLPAWQNARSTSRCYVVSDHCLKPSSPGKYDLDFLGGGGYYTNTQAALTLSPWEPIAEQFS